MSFIDQLMRCIGVTLGASALMFVAALSQAPTNPNVLDYGADNSGTVDNGPIFTRLMPALCGKTVTVPQGTYKFTTAPTDPKCGVSLIMDPNAKLVDARGLDAFDPLLMMSGTTGTSVSLGADGTFNQMSLQVADASGFCAANTDVPNPACALKVSSDYSWSPLGHHIGEIHLIKSISGNTLTLFEPLEDGYLVSDNAIATPTALISDVTIRGGRVVGPTVDNINEGIEVQGCYRCTFADTVFTGFAGEGKLVINDVLHFEVSHISCIGINGNALADSYCASVQDASEFGLLIGLQCWDSGPCGTLEDSDVNPGTTRHIKFVDGATYDPTGINRGGWGTHYQGQDIVFDNVTCVFQVSGGGVNHCIGGAIFDLEINNSHCWYAQVCFSDEVTWPSPLAGYFRVLNSDATGSGQHCILVQGPVVGGTGDYTSLVISGNRLRSCGTNGILFTSTTAIVPGQTSVQNNDISLWGHIFDAIRLAPLIDKAVISDNNINGQFIGGNGITGGDFNDTVISGNNINTVANNCLSLGAGVSNGISGLKIANLHCDGYGTAGAYAGIIIQDSVAGLTIVNPTIKGAGVGADGAITVLSYVSPGSISGCNITNAQGYGVEVNGGGADFSIRGCTVEGYNLKPGEYHGIDVGAINGLTLVDNQVSGGGGVTSSGIVTRDSANLIEIGNRVVMPAGTENYGIVNSFPASSVGGGVVSGNTVTVASGSIGTVAGIAYDPFATSGVSVTIGPNYVSGYTTPLLIGNDPGIRVTWPMTATSTALNPAAGSCASTTVTVPGADNLTTVSAMPTADPGAGVTAATAWMSSPGLGIATVQACALSGASPNSVTYAVNVTK